MGEIAGFPDGIAIFPGAIAIRDDVIAIFPRGIAIRDGRIAGNAGAIAIFPVSIAGNDDGIAIFPDAIAGRDGGIAIRERAVAIVGAGIAILLRAVAIVPGVIAGRIGGAACLAVRPDRRRPAIAGRRLVMGGRRRVADRALMVNARWQWSRGWGLNVEHRTPNFERRREAVTGRMASADGQ